MPKTTMLFFSVLSALSVSVNCFATEYDDPLFEYDEVVKYESVEVMVNSDGPTIVSLPAHRDDDLTLIFTLTNGKMSLFDGKKDYLKAKIGSKSKKVEIGDSFSMHVSGRSVQKGRDAQNPYKISCTQQKDQ